MIFVITPLIENLCLLMKICNKIGLCILVWIFDTEIFDKGSISKYYF